MKSRITTELKRIASTSSGGGRVWWVDVDHKLRYGKVTYVLGDERITMEPSATDALPVSTSRPGLGPQRGVAGVAEPAGGSAAVKRRGLNPALIAVFAALIAVAGLVPGFTIGPIPFVLTIVIVLVSPLILGTWNAVSAALLYMVVGLMGFPIFAGGTSGFAVFIGPTGGYLLGYGAAALVAGPCARLVLVRLTSSRASGRARLSNQTAVTAWLCLPAVAGLVSIHVLGVCGLVINTGMTLNDALAVSAGFLPLDLVKAVFAAVIASAAFRAYPRLLALRW